MPLLVNGANVSPSGQVAIRQARLWAHATLRDAAATSDSRAACR